MWKSEVFWLWRKIEKTAYTYVVLSCSLQNFDFSLNSKKEEGGLHKKISITMNLSVFILHTLEESIWRFESGYFSYKESCTFKISSLYSKEKNEAVFRLYFTFQVSPYFISFSFARIRAENLMISQTEKMGIPKSYLNVSERGWSLLFFSKNNGFL